ncbi:MAG: dienelactone hydrolase family protein [Dehalococcoidia bacterium]
MADVRSEMVQFANDGRQVAGYLARPSTEGAPGVIVIQEWWGLVDHIKDVADRFARDGFVALAPDLYEGKQTEEPDNARKLVMEMDRARAMSDLEAAARYLRSIGCRRIGAVGYCMGGGLVWELATRQGTIDAAAPYYGRPISADRAGDVSIPVEAFYAELDQGIPVAGVQEVVTALRNAGKDADLHVYEGAEHAFFNDSRPSSYHADASADAWRRTLAFFRRTLGEPAGITS